MQLFGAKRAFFACIILFVMSFHAGANAMPGTPQSLATDPQKLVIETQTGPVAFHVELALTPKQRSIGLMYRQSMAPDHGMLFRFDHSMKVLMWMKNTPLPLDMVFIDDSGVVTGIAADRVAFSETIISSPGKARYVLELNAGTAAKMGILAGDKVSHPAIGD